VISDALSQPRNVAIRIRADDVEMLSDGLGELANGFFEEQSDAIRLLNHPNVSFGSVPDLRPFTEVVVSQPVPLGHGPRQLLFQKRVAPERPKCCEYSAHGRGRKRFYGPFDLGLSGELLRKLSGER